MKLSPSQIKEFWLHQKKFLGNPLITETPHELSSNLSYLCKNNLSTAFNVFQQIELQSIAALRQYIPAIESFKKHILLALENNNKIFLVGCGASGRLAMLIKRIFEEENPQQNKLLVCVAAAGDISLIRSVEEFEDHTEFGVKQLIAQGYTNNDLVVGLSASGESNFILGAIDYAAKNSIHKPYIICNNPITAIITRNPKHIAAKKNYINVLSLDVGAMALTGSTRLQATSAMQIVLALAFKRNKTTIASQIDEIYNLLAKIPLEDLSEITTIEATLLKNKNYILYTTNNRILGLSLLADTTERAPTFNLPPFENQNNLPSNNFSHFYLNIQNTHNAADVWQQLFANDPTCLNWSGFNETTSQYINGFDLSNSSKRYLGSYLPQKQYLSSWQINNKMLQIKLQDKSYTINLPGDLWHQSLIFKLLLNSYSTLMMGRLGFFVGNLMVSLKPSNYKLIDRAIRYIIFTLKFTHDVDVEYKIVADILFKELPKLQANESIVLKIVNLLVNKVT